MLYSPKVTFNAGLDYTLVVGKGTLRPRINYTYIDAQFTNLLYNPITDRLPYARVVVGATHVFAR